MSTNKQDKAKQNLLKQIEQLSKIDLKQQTQWLLVVGKSNFSQTGFVLPTTVMVLLVATLVVGALLVRSFSRTSQVISEREQKVIYNTATPAIDRAKAKIEYLFKKDDRLPSGVPSDAVLLSMMLNDGLNGIPEKATDKYTFTDETRLNVGGTTDTDNAWAFKVDKDGDGTLETTIAYSILSNTSKSTTTTTGSTTETTTVGINDSEATKASNLIVRNGPIAGSQVANVNCLADSRTPEQGWYPITNTTLRKSFQINAFVVNNNPANRTVATLELQQDRQINRGNKWGAWFRNDLEIWPNPNFNFNGAMHTEGSLMVQGNNEVNGYMLSSQNSCFYTKDSSEITVAKSNDYSGQVVSGTINTNGFGGNSTFHLFNGLGTAPIKSGIEENNTSLNPSTDSIEGDADDLINLIEDISLDPLAVFTRNVSRHRNSTKWSRSATWATESFVKKGRIFNDTSPPPYLDDTYRADNRYGPKPGYTPDLVIPTANKTGDDIGSVTALTNDPSATGSEDFGLDGYWERRARKNGLRLIVGQRLELGNAYGWGGANDPLNPPDSTTISNEQRQRRALRDNLAAVQATAVYHHEKNSGYFPVACVSTTVHPGTAQTIADSTNFQTTKDFFTGKGTNGWEYAPPASDETTFATAIGSSQPLGKALRNLAYFAGDPDGAFPPKQETSGSIVHPYPNLTMWGDFSNLRRVIRKLDAVPPTRYSDLSIADKTYLHTASCSLGMLAENIDDVTAASTEQFKNQGSANSLGVEMWKIFGGATGNSTGISGNYCNKGVCTIPPIEVFLADLSAADRQKVLVFNMSQQIKRDREYGFMSVATASTLFTFKDGKNDYNFKFSPACNPGIENSTVDKLFKGDGNGLEKNKAAIAMICEVQTKYPSLFYLFPVTAHSHAGSSTAIPPNNQPITEPYVGNAYISGTGVNGSYTYKLLTDTDVAAIAIKPRATADWILPKTTIASGSPNKIVAPNNTNLYVPFLDTAFSNGRESMSVRVLNIDLDILRSNLVTNDTWLPSKDGIIYAFREDAVREDAIARPASTDWSTYETDPTNAAYRMSATTPKDPPVNSANGISAKPVDYYADPDRRPYGFRLKNGESVKRIGITTDNINGLSFISDNAVYTQGDFNLHSTNGTTTNLLEEFTQKLVVPWTATPEFYDGRTAIEPKFADPAQDTWRPTEILTDGITILSQAFNDGKVEDAFLVARPAIDNATNTSYQNQNRPTDSTPWSSSGYWLHEDPTYSGNGVSPIKIDKNGYPLYCNSTTVPCPSPIQYTGTFYGFNSNDKYFDLNTAVTTRVNAIFVSGLVPSRAYQSYGGLHNFPRFLENWRNSASAHLNGAFLQLNFSTSATGPFDQDAWEPGTVPSSTSGELHSYYRAPLRPWGYDVGLQYAPAGPVARRFVTASNTRSEFYRELAVENPYIKNLRCAIYPSGSTRVDTSLTSAACP